MRMGLRGLAGESPERGLDFAGGSPERGLDFAGGSPERGLDLAGGSLREHRAWQRAFERGGG